MKNIIKHFKGLCNISDDRISIKGLGNGLINDTFKVEITNNSSTQSFVLQKVNHHIFTNVELMQNNIYIVTNHIRQKLIQRGEDNIKNKTLNIIPTLDNKLYYFNGKEYWRMTDFIEDSQSFDLINEKYAYLAGKAFGDFHSMLADLPNDSLKYTIENFHNIEYRIEQFKQSINLDIAARVKEKNKYKVANNTIDIKVEELIIELLSRGELMSKVEQMGRDGLLVKRITHCDTKVNNMLFDNKGKFLCIIDLDTTMPGYVLSDFGDFIRTAANTSAEDEIDTSKIIKPYLIEIKKLKDVLAYNVKIIDKLKYSKAQVDTIYRDSIIYLPKTQKHYFEKNKYEAWISGYNPVLDSINVFNRIEYKTITNTVKETIYKEKWNWYLETGINSIDSKIAPYVGIRLTMPNNFGIGGNIGVFDNKAFYGFSINYKIK